MKQTEQHQAGEPTPKPAFDGPAWQEFSTRLNELAVAHIYAVRGLMPQADDLMQSVAQMGGDPDSAMKIVPAPPWGSGVPSYGEMPIRDVPSFLGKGGPAEALIGHMWIVAVSTDWNESYRERVATDLGMKDQNELKVPALGDLRLFRHDIAHCRGIASANNSGKAEVFGDWITVGKPIVIGENQILSFMEKLGIAERAGQAVADEMLGLMNMADTERERLGVDRIVLRRGQPDPAVDVVQCPVCRQRSKNNHAATCPHCGAACIRSRHASNGF